MNWAPTTDEEIVQNVASIVATSRGTQPFLRALGIADLHDRPVAVAEARVASTLNTQIRTYEPRATVAKITVAVSADGATMAPTVRLR